MQIIKNFFAKWQKRLAIFTPLTLVAGGVIGGIILWGGFNTGMEMTNTMTFCVSCHEMRDNVYQEYKETVHYQNASGVQVSCSDCHVPKPWGHKVIRKIKASTEVYHWLLGTIDTPEKFNQHRWTMANRVWNEMKATDSRECRNCHSFEGMDLSEQDRSARRRHSTAVEKGQTCIDCHKGIAHEEPDEPEEEEESTDVTMLDPGQ